MTWPGPRLRRHRLILPAPGQRERVPEPVSAAVVGGGLAGLAAATILAERGVQVTVIERAQVLGGRLASWEDTLASGERFDMCRGFHAFFRNYYNLRALMQRLALPAGTLVPLTDYPILGPDRAMESFAGLPRTPPFNVMALAHRTPTLRRRDLLRVNVRAAMDMLRFEGASTYQRHDHQTAAAYLDSLRFPPRARQMLFNVFSHSFFNPEESMSAAELLMMFHVYFFGNPEGLIFDVASAPFSRALLTPLGRHLERHGARVRLGTRARRLARTSDARWRVELEGDAVTADLVVLALNVDGLQRLVQASPDLDAPGWRQAVAGLAVTSPFAIWRLWLDRPARPGRAPFAGTTGLGALDNISLYHRFQDQSACWAQRMGGAVVELHAYALPQETDAAALRAELLRALGAVYPELAGASIIEDRFLLRRDCPAFGPGSHASRPGVDTPLRGLALAGDFVKLPIPCALMERATTSGMLAANHLLARWQVQPEPLWSVPPRGLFARPGDPDSAGSQPAAEPRDRSQSRSQRSSQVPGPAGAARSPWLLGKAPAPRGPRAIAGQDDWRRSSARWIQTALGRALARPSGGWYVVDASRRITASPRTYPIAGRALVAWRDRDAARVAPEACPHMGASLAGAVVRDGALVCRWHGLALGPEPQPGWCPLPAHDDGVLTWTRLGDEPATGAPVLPARPAVHIASVLRMEARCEPRDVIANRLDPWHGTHYHPHSFSRLQILDMDEDAIVVRVVYRILGRVGMEVDARFHCPEPRTIVMTIVAGEGAGSVVETHATPIGPGRTAITEAILATSARRGFGLVRWLGAGLLGPLMRRAAQRLWVEDAAYAERLYLLREGRAAGEQAA